MKNLIITHEFPLKLGSGLQMTFENGNTISIQFGIDSYCDNNKDLQIDEFGNVESNNAEVSIWNKEGKQYYPGPSHVRGWRTPDEIAECIMLAKTTNF